MRDNGKLPPCVHGTWFVDDILAWRFPDQETFEQMKECADEQG